MKPFKLKLLKHGILIRDLLLAQRRNYEKFEALEERFTDQEASTAMLIDESLETSEEALSGEFNREIAELKQEMNERAIGQDKLIKELQAALDKIDPTS